MDPISWQGSEVTLSPYGITHKIEKRLPFGVGVGDKFRAREIESTMTILSISDDKNELEVDFGTWRETWNLAHTIVGFRNGIYKKAVVS